MPQKLSKTNAMKNCTKNLYKFFFPNRDTRIFESRTKALSTTTFAPRPASTIWPIFVKHFSPLIRSERGVVGHYRLRQAPRPIAATLCLSEIMGLYARTTVVHKRNKDFRWIRKKFGLDARRAFLCALAIRPKFHERSGQSRTRLLRLIIISIISASPRRDEVHVLLLQRVEPSPPCSVILIDSKTLEGRAKR